jgi:hypothetical protein
MRTFGPITFVRSSIVSQGSVFMRRWVVMLARHGAVRIHNIVRADAGPYHDHAWDFVSIVLRGWYVEDRAPDEDSNAFRRRWLSIAFRRAETRHRIVTVSPGGCWTLVFTGPPRRLWGFATADGWVPYYDYDGDAP